MPELFYVTTRNGEKALINERNLFGGFHSLEQAKEYRDEVLSENYYKDLEIHSLVIIHSQTKRVE